MRIIGCRTGSSSICLCGGGRSMRLPLGTYRVRGRGGILCSNLSLRILLENTHGECFGLVCTMLHNDWGGEADLKWKRTELNTKSHLFASLLKRKTEGQVIFMLAVTTNKVANLLETSGYQEHKCLCLPHLTELAETS